MTGFPELARFFNPYYYEKLPNRQEAALPLSYRGIINLLKSLFNYIPIELSSFVPTGVSTSADKQGNVKELWYYTMFYPRLNRLEFVFESGYIM